MTLVATELATNAVNYSSPPAAVRLLRTDVHLVLDGADRNLAILPGFLDARSGDAGGRGLALTHVLASDVG